MSPQALDQSNREPLKEANNWSSELSMSSKVLLFRSRNFCYVVLIYGFFFSGFGCDTAAVVNILAHRDATQRALIQQEYRVMYSDDILKRLSSELSGKLEVLTIPTRLLMTSWRQRSMEHIYFLITFYFFFLFSFYILTIYLICF